MAKITKIEPQIPALPTRKKVAAYARVSMETERLHHSLSSQISYYSELIQKNPEWEYVGVYTDEAITGTIAKKRDEFQRLIADCETGKIDIVLTKSISRFAWNTVDLLKTVRHLKELGISVRFEKENIDSLSGDGEVMLTLLASFAQSESESISTNVKWGVRKRMEQGTPNGHFRVYGYRWEDDQLVIVPEEAVIVKRIYQNFLDGKSLLETEREFAAEGITTRDGCRWVDSNIKVVLSNITYTGNMLLQKEYIADPISKKRKKNHGELPQYYVENTHEAIIPMETFQYVQDEMARRRELGAFANKSMNITCFTAKLKCAECGNNYRRQIRKKSTGEKYHLYACATTNTCSNNCIHEDTLRELFKEKIDHVSISPGGHITFCFYDGHEEAMAKRGKGKKYYSGVHPFSSKIKCGQCGSWYASKVWHSTDKYRRTIWQCNHKYDGGEHCSTPHLTDEQIQDAFLSAANKLLATKDAVIANGREMMALLFDTTELETERDRLLDEAQMVSDAVQQNIYENAHVDLDQKAYQKKYDDLTARYETLKARLDELNEQISQLQLQKGSYEDFIRAFKKQPDQITEFSLNSFNGLVDFITVNVADDIQVTFRNGQTIKA